VSVRALMCLVWSLRMRRVGEIDHEWWRHLGDDSMPEIIAETWNADFAVAVHASTYGLEVDRA